MIKIEGDKAALYQWDLNQRVVLTNIPNIGIGIEVHFSSIYDSEECCLSAPSYKEDSIIYADIPNKLLQQNGTLHVYLYVQDENKAWTEYSTEILVLKRKKPANYVYTETEVKTYEQLEKRIIILEEDTGSNIFEAKYDETTFDEIAEAYNAGKIVCCKHVNTIAHLCDIDESRGFSTFVFHKGESGVTTITCTRANGWAIRVTTVATHEDIENAINFIDLTEPINTALAQAKESGEFDGADGKDGADGYTPQKGVDYFTEEDIAEVRNAVLAEFVNVAEVGA